MQERKKELEEQLGLERENLRIGAELEQARKNWKAAQQAAQNLKEARQQRAELEEQVSAAQESLRKATELEQQQRERLVGSKARIQAMRESFALELQPAEIEAERKKKQNEIEQLQQAIEQAQKHREADVYKRQIPP